MDNRGIADRAQAGLSRILPYLASLWRRQDIYWRRFVIRSVDHAAVVRRLDEDAVWSARYAFMLLMSAGIAVLGLLLSSPAVVIGAMLISPLMGPIMALGFSLALFDFPEARRALATLGGGIAATVVFCAIIVALSPLQAVTTEILARTRPNFFDLLVAIFSALAGAYAVIRGRGETIVGVAIATALMPPLAVVGFGVATMNATVFFGSLGLFMTNLLAIALSAAVMAKIYGFGTDITHQSTRVQTISILVIFALLSLPLGLSLRQIAWEAVTSRQTRDIISDYFGASSRVSQLEIDYAAKPIVARATVQTTGRRYDADTQISRRLTSTVGEPITAQVSQIIVDSEATLRERERRELEETRRIQGETLKRANEADGKVVAAELAILGAQSADEISIDLARRRALLTADAIPGVRLPAWRELEGRVAARHPGWAVIVVPPVEPLPLVPFDPDAATLSARGIAAVADAAWALTRWGINSAVVNGRAASNEADSATARNALANERAAVVEAALQARGIIIASRSATGGPQTGAENEFGRASLRSVQIIPDTMNEAPAAAR